MSEMIQVTFKGNQRDFFINPDELPLRISDSVIVEAERGEDLGVVTQIGRLVQLKLSRGLVRKVMRKATSPEMTRFRENRDKEEHAYHTCRVKIEKHNLSMKLIDVAYQFDRSHLTFFFSAEKRVDFRDLVKDLAAEHHTRIELRQIGVRDEAKRLGGYGVCGRELCCTSFIKNFDSITTDMAKEQGLSLNPSKLSGVCGRLKCCLKYEHPFYEEVHRRFPSLAMELITPQGKGVMRRVDVFKELMWVQYEDQTWDSFTLEQLKEILPPDAFLPRMKEATEPGKEEAVEMIGDDILDKRNIPDTMEQVITLEQILAETARTSEENPPEEPGEPPNESDH
jgi:cell fate regulator YaaT (PSP1 superfamily)